MLILSNLLRFVITWVVLVPPNCGSSGLAKGPLLTAVVFHVLKAESSFTSQLVAFRHSAYPLPFPKEIRGSEGGGEEP